MPRTVKVPQRVTRASSSTKSVVARWQIEQLFALGPTEWISNNLLKPSWWIRVGGRVKEIPLQISLHFFEVASHVDLDGQVAVKRQHVGISFPGRPALRYSSRSALKCAVRSGFGRLVVLS